MMTNTAQKIKIELIKRNITCADIARKIGVHRSAITHTVNGRLSSYRLQQAIADSIKIPVHELWPSAFPKKREAQNTSA
jgi:lambda repressor-like predicted transcriptional regulator